jgi:hypothetical protein
MTQILHCGKDYDTEKLPRWADEYIGSQAREIRELRKEMAARTDDHPGSNVVIDGGCVYPDLNLRDFAEMLFYLGPGRDRWNDTVEVRISRTHSDRMDIRACPGMAFVPTGNGTIQIRMLDK